MDQATINIWAVLAAVAAKQLIGFLWYSPALFGRTFAEGSGQTDEEIRPRFAKALAGEVAGALVLALILAHIVSFAGVVSAFFGALLGLICWVGFVGTATMSPTLFERRPIKLWALQNGYLVLAYAAMGAILGGWR